MRTILPNLQKGIFRRRSQLSVVRSETDIRCAKIRLVMKESSSGLASGSAMFAFIRFQVFHGAQCCADVRVGWNKSPLSKSVLWRFRYVTKRKREDSREQSKKNGGKLFALRHEPDFDRRLDFAMWRRSRVLNVKSFLIALISAGVGGATFRRVSSVNNSSRRSESSIFPDS